MLGSLEQDKIRMLDGHKVLRDPPTAALNPFLHSTVSAIAHSKNGRVLFSGSYDKTVKTWLGEDGTCLDSLDVKSEVLRMATSPVHEEALAVALKDGNVIVLDVGPDGRYRGKGHRFAPLKKNVEAVAVSWHGQVRPDWLIVGYDNKSGNKTGDLEIFDARAMKLVWSVVPGSNRQFDMFVHESGQFVTGGAVNGRGERAKTQVRVWDFEQGHDRRRPRPILDFDNPQEDINMVTMS